MNSFELLDKFRFGKIAVYCENADELLRFEKILDEKKMFNYIDLLDDIHRWKTPCYVFTVEKTMCLNRIEWSADAPARKKSYYFKNFESSIIHDYSGINLDWYDLTYEEMEYIHKIVCRTEEKYRKIEERLRQEENDRNRKQSQQI